MIKPIVAVVGLGYVGLPLAIEFSKKYTTIGFDLSKEKITKYKKKFNLKEKEKNRLSVSTNPKKISLANIIIITVPTPVTKSLKPDLSSLVSSSSTVGKYMKKGAIVVYESTVYPGVTEEVCVPLLEKHSDTKWKKDFHIGYSPERINPGDNKHTIKNVVKIIAADDVTTLKTLVNLYQSIIDVKVHTVSSIKVAEAAKVIENTQRDLNIALMNEIAIIFNRLGIDTHEVLQAAKTKWNFLPFQPGLVGGHCIGVDPYYLTHKAEMLGYKPKVILAGRKINDGMATYLAKQTIKLMTKAKKFTKGCKVIVLGLTFKENHPDLRNSKVANVVYKLQHYGCNVFVHDPIANSDEAEKEYGIKLVSWEKLPKSEVIFSAVPHKEYINMEFTKLTNNLKKNGVFIDVKSTYDHDLFLAKGFRFWRL